MRRKGTMWRRDDVVAHKPQKDRSHVPWLNRQINANIRETFNRNYDDQEIAQVVIN